ncbi:hypothetical protein QTL95_10635 [Rhizobium sp. S152]|uniref:hypothetical protein n=1 Tax=Rhizobium sp. S152 TaxID=3055038 RepID=UPI0025A97DD0|nr:hypothetical protein [Rhizobium sp. S152]MDM9626354.1 hypothetical protein [Rhizobium sp. S152]
MDLAYLAKNVASAERARLRLLRSGFTISGHKIWSSDEDKICQIFYPDYFALCQILDTRSKKAIQTRCQRLGLVPARQSWQWAARQQLRKLYPAAHRDEICEAFPGVEWKKIQSAARYYGYRRTKKPYKITGILSLDQSRRRCYDIKWTMRDLDEEAGTKRYFQTRGYRSDYPNYKAIGRAAIVLGGRLEVRWNEDS